MTRKSSPIGLLAATLLPIAFGLSSGLSAKEDPGAADTQDPANWDRIAFVVKSWGETITQWQYTPDYGGVWIEVDRKEDTGDQRVWTRTYHGIEADPARYAELAALVRSLPDPAPDADDCTDFMADAPYGTIRLTRGATTTEIAWNAGCMDPGYKRFIEKLRAADRLVSGWGKENPVTRTEDSLVP